MKPTMLAFAIMLAVAMLVGGNARADIGRVEIGENCAFFYEEDTFDGMITAGVCVDDANSVRITVRCMNNTTNLIIDTNKYMLKDGLHLRTALDSTETSAWSWSMSTDRESLFIHPAIPTIKEMLEHSRLEIRIIERDGDIHNADIDISRLDEAIHPVRKFCG